MLIELFKPIVRYTYYPIMDNDAIREMIQHIRASLEDAQRRAKEDEDDSDDNEPAKTVPKGKSSRLTVQVSDIARAVITRKQYGMCMNADMCSDWIDSKPVIGNSRAAPDVLIVQKHAHGRSGDANKSFLAWVFDNPRLMFTQNHGEDCACYMFGLMPHDNNKDATDEIFHLWSKHCSFKPKWTPQHIIFDQADTKVILLRQYVTFDTAVKTWPNVYKVEPDRTSIRMYVNEAMMYQYLLDMWFMDGVQDLRSVITGSKFALGCKADIISTMVKDSVKMCGEIATKHQHVCKCEVQDDVVRMKITPVDDDKLVAHVKAAYPNLQGVKVKYQWTNPYKDEYVDMMTKHHMCEIKLHEDVFRYKPRYKYAKGKKCVPFNPAEISPLSCLREVESRVYGSEVRKWGYSDIETCLRLCHRHLPVWIPREIWNGIVRLALYYHAGTVLSKIFKLPKLDMTFEKIITMSRP
jgi:hypothetical protein